MTPILVTGATGYLGRHILARAAAEQGAAIGMSWRGADGTIACDLRDGAATARLIRQTGAQTVIHCAARVPKNAADYGSEEAARDNSSMIESLCGAAVTRIVFPSSMSVYSRDSAMPVREDEKCEPETAYGASKRWAEKRLLATISEVICLRFPGLFGPPRRSGLLYNVARAFAAGEAPALDDDPPLWAGLHVEDAADICLRAARSSGLAREIINAGYPGAMSVDAGVAALARRFQRETPRAHSGPLFEMDLSRLAARIGLPAHSFDARLEQFVESMPHGA